MIPESRIARTSNGERRGREATLTSTNRGAARDEESIDLDFCIMLPTSLEKQSELILS